MFPIDSACVFGGRAEQLCEGDARDSQRILECQNAAAACGRHTVCRFRAHWLAEVRGAGMRVPCTVVDISSVGACLRLDHPAPRSGAFHLVIGGGPPIAAIGAWRKNALFGVRFLREQSWVLDSCGKRFDPAAWIKD